MSNADKLLKNKKEKKPRERTKKVKADVNNLPDAIVDGILRVKDKSKVVFARTLNGRTKLHEGYIASVKGDVVEVWDETQNQFWVVELKNPPLVFKAKSVSELT